MRLSICIPTFNRAAHLTNCLRSIAASRAASSHEIQVCLSDNCSTDDTARVVSSAQQGMPIKYFRQSSNIGLARNILAAAAIADGDFVWLLGDDDLLLPDAVDRVCGLLDAHPNVDYFYVNAFHLTTEYVLSRPQPFDTRDLPADMTRFSSWPASGEMPFLDLIDPKISFDFLGGIFLSVFRRDRWRAHAGALGAAALADNRVFSAFDNTFPHVKVFANAFAASKAFFLASPVSVCLTGAREWAPMYPMIRSVRLVEALGEYRRNGLSWLRYHRCRNSALDTFVPDLAYMYIHKDVSGYAYIDPIRLFLSNCLYPNVYFSILYYVLRKARRALRGGRS